MTSKVAADGDNYTYERPPGVLMFNASLAPAEAKALGLEASVDLRTMAEKERDDVAMLERRIVALEQEVAALKAGRG